jgi:hypothetical protein
MTLKITMVRDAVRWRFGQRQTRRREPSFLLERMILLGDWLEAQDYVGIDVKPNHPPRFMATVPASALIGWLNLADVEGDAAYRRKADVGLQRILNDQKADGCWLFPYRFRKNPPDFPYACENFMTIEALMAYAARIEKTDRLLASIDQALQFLLNRVGDENGAFYYSPADKIRIPNISSMAARVFAEAAALLGKPEYAERAIRFARYCVSQQAPDGSYPYMEGASEVSVPYHALEIWELAEANRRFNDPEIARSLAEAIRFLGRTLAENGYAYFYPAKNRAAVLKAPIWSAKAFLSMGLLDQALAHFWRGLELFGVPGAGHYFYLLQDIHGFRFPRLDTPYVRYNASTMEIGTSLLCQIR